MTSEAKTTVDVNRTASVCGSRDGGSSPFCVTGMPFTMELDARQGKMRTQSPRYTAVLYNKRT